MMMKREVFRDRFLAAAQAARELAQARVAEPLPTEMRFHVHLNRSYDAHSGEAYRLFPEDSSDEVALRTKHLVASEVVKLLWRDGLVPQWADLSVVAENGESTIIEVLVCGRYTDDEPRLYHQGEGRPPFHVAGPTLPPGHEGNEPFSIHTRTTCWSSDDLAYALGRATSPWSLELYGPQFSDESIEAYLAFPNLEMFEAHATGITGAGLAALAQLPRLRMLRIGWGDLDRLELHGLPRLPGVESMSLANMPAEVTGVSRVPDALPNLSELRLTSALDVVADDKLVAPRLLRLALDFPSPPDWVESAPGLHQLSLHHTRCTDEQVAERITRASESLTSVVLRGTPVSDAVFAVLARVPALSHVDLVDTRITQPALREFAATRPELTYYPRAPTAELCVRRRSRETGDRW